MRGRGEGERQRQDAHCRKRCREPRSGEQPKDLVEREQGDDAADPAQPARPPRPWPGLGSFPAARRRRPAIAERKTPLTTTHSRGDPKSLGRAVSNGSSARVSPRRSSWHAAFPRDHREDDERSSMFARTAASRSPRSTSAAAAVIRTVSSWSPNASSRSRGNASRASSRPRACAASLLVEESAASSSRAIASTDSFASRSASASAARPRWSGSVRARMRYSMSPRAFAASSACFRSIQSRSILSASDAMSRESFDSRRRKANCGSCLRL